MSYTANVLIMMFMYKLYLRSPPREPGGLPTIASKNHAATTPPPQQAPREEKNDVGNMSDDLAAIFPWLGRSIPGTRQNFNSYNLGQYRNIQKPKRGWQLDIKSLSKPHLTLHRHSATTIHHQTTGERFSSPWETCDTQR